MKLVWSFILVLQGSVAALRSSSQSPATLSAPPLRGTALLGQHTKKNNDSQTPTAPTFLGWYNDHAAGPGIWKWSNALAAYQHHLAPMMQKPVSVLEVGVQSGGSVSMWQTVMGAQCHYYGMDINDKCTSFTGSMSTIFIGDQGQVADWSRFFSTVVGALDVVVDDGGHLGYQMVTTLQQVFPHLNPGGVHAVEDIHNQNGDYMTHFFNPAADFIASQATSVASVHIYPYLLMVQKTSSVAQTEEQASVAVSTIPELMAAMPNNRGKTIRLANPQWGSFHTADALKNIFGTFNELHGGKIVQEPAGCHSVEHGACTMRVEDSSLQALVFGVHIYPSATLVEVAQQPPVIEAVRKGDVWIPYGKR